MVSAPPKRNPYRNPPIEEALVEFRLVPGQDWDLTIPGKLHERVKDAYPGKPRHQKLLQATVHARPGLPTGLAMEEGIARVQLVDGDVPRKLLSLGPDVLSVNALRPYEGWKEFRPRIEVALHAYVDVIGSDNIGRIGVRYINKIVIPCPDIKLADYFACGPRVPPDLPNRLGGFLTRVEHLYEDGVKLLMTFASIDNGTNPSAFLLDLDVIWEGHEPIDATNALAMVDDLHEREGAAFESLVTDLSRQVFNAA